MIVDRLVTRYEADSSPYVKAVEKMLSSTNSAKGAAEGLTSAVGTFSAELGMVGKAFTVGLVAAGAVVTAIGAITVELGKMGIEASKRAADFDALIMALAAVEGGLDKASSRWKELRELAKAPGIGPDEALQGYTQLRRSGLAPDFAKSLMREFANQNALSGGGKEEFGRLMRAAMQIATKPFLQGDELFQLSDAGLPAHKMIKDIFGTSDTEELKRRGITSAQVLSMLVVEMAKAARVGDSAKNVIENFGTAIDQIVVSIGQGVNGTLIPAAGGLTKAVEDVTNAGVFKDLGQKIAQDFEFVAEALFGSGSMEDAILAVVSAVEVGSSALRTFYLNMIELGKGLIMLGPRLLQAIPLVGAQLAAAATIPASLALAGIGGLQEEFNSTYSANKLQMSTYRKTAEKEAAASVSTTTETPAQTKTNSILQSIADNTRPLRDMGRATLGSGPNNPISAIELGGLRSAHANRATRMLVEAIGLFIQPHLLDMAKAGR